MRMVHGEVASARTGDTRPVVAVPSRAGGEQTPCAARPGSRLVHLDGRCECFFGGPPPEFGSDVVPGGTLP